MTLVVSIRLFFDKTGTLTAGTPTVARKETYGEDSEEALNYLVSVERESEPSFSQSYP